MSYAEEWGVIRDAYLDDFIQGLIDPVTERAVAAEERESSLRIQRDMLLADGAEKDALIAQLRIEIEDLRSQIPSDEEPEFGPLNEVFQASPLGLAVLRDRFKIPMDANLVLIPATETRSLEQIHAQGSANDIFCFENRTEPYWYDVANGPMAPGVAAYDGVDANGRITRAVRNADGSWTGAVRITNSGTRAWFGFTRTRRGLVGMGPDVRFAPRGTLVRPSFAVLEDNTQLPQAERYQYRYDANGNRAGIINGCPVKLLEAEQDSTFFANITLDGPENDFGGMQYSGLSIKGNGQHVIFRCRFRGAWHGTQGVPNTEAGALALNGGAYLRERNQYIPIGTATSAVMTNNSLGGTARRESIPKVSNGLLTHWRPTGVHIMEDMHIEGGHRSFNLEELRPNFVLRWTRGSFKVDRGIHHFGINPYVPGSNQPAPPKIELVDVEVSPDAWAYVNGLGAGLDANVYQGSASDPICAKRSWITHTIGGVPQPVHCVPSVRWVD